MNNISLIANIALVLSFGAGFAFGLQKCLTTRKVLYFQMITAAIGCGAVTRLYNVVSLLCNGGYERGFNVGLIGPISCFSLLFCAEFGALDSLVDKTNKKNKQAGYIALIAPAVLAAVSTLIIKSDDIDIIYRIFISFTLAMICFAAYYDFKHLILTKTDNEMFQPLRKYYILALLLETLYVLELVFISYGNRILFAVTAALVLAVSLAILPVLDKGVAKWTI